jgi:hypothetical protein
LICDVASIDIGGIRVSKAWRFVTHDNMAFWDYEAPSVRYTHLVQSYFRCVQECRSIFV